MQNPISIGTQKQLFFDDYCLEELSGVRRRFHQPRKHPANPLLATATLNEELYLYGNVLYDKEQQQFRMWYHQRYYNVPGSPSQIMLNGHATSKDGIHWEKSKLNLFKHDKVDFSSAVMVGPYPGPTVFHTPDDPDPQRRYRLLVFMEEELLNVVKDRRTAYRTGYGVMFSPDGYRWTPYELNPVIQGSDNTSCMYDPVTQEYIAFPRAQKTDHGMYRRCVGVTTSKDFLRWGSTDTILSTDEEDDRRVEARLERFRNILLMDDPSYYSADLYNMAAFRYENLRIGLYTLYDRSSGTPHDDGIVNIQLAYSRDPNPYGYWHRVNRQDFLPCGNEGDRDAAMVYPSSNIVEVGDELWFYYGGFDRSHGRDARHPVTTRCLSKIPMKGSSVNLATLRRDGFVSIDALYTSGRLTTKLLRATGTQLEVNAAAENGHIHVEILDEQGKALPGFTKEECIPFSQDAVRGTIKWKSGASVDTLQNKPIRLVFHIEMSSLFAFKFV